MAVPRNRHSNSRKNLRRAHDFRKPKSLTRCPNCKTECVPHSVCKSCGQYRGRQILAVANQAE